jgi:hypothetical protein
MTSSDFVTVTKDQFFAAIYARKLNVHPRNERHATYWEMPDRTVIGRTKGYADHGVGFYEIIRPFA